MSIRSEIVGNRVAVIRRFWPMALPGLVYALFLTGCVSATVARYPEAGADTSCITPTAQQDTVVGISFSGGGSRAALFAEAGLEALAKLRAPQGRSVLEQASYLSSVSAAVPNGSRSGPSN